MKDALAGATANREKVHYNTGASVPPKKGMYSQAVRVGNQIWTAGQTSKNVQTGEITHKGDIKGQAQQVFENIKGLLAAHGATFDDVVKRTIYLKDINHLETVYEVGAKYFTNPNTFPACVCIAARDLAHPDYMVEIDVVAVLPDDKA